MANGYASRVRYVVPDLTGKTFGSPWRRDLKDFAPRLFQSSGQQPLAQHEK
jgi:hypothetical protein